MIKTFLLIFRPAQTWEKIAREQRGIFFILFVFLFPLMAVSSAGEIYGLAHWSKHYRELGDANTLPLATASDYVAIQFLLSLLVLFCDAFVLKALGETFHSRHNYSRAVTTLAYSLGPLFLFRLLHVIPLLHWWMVWLVGILFTLAVLYYGLIRVMQPDPTHALGLYFMTAVLLVITTFLAQLVVSLVLKSKLTLFAPLFR